ncbi:hypothetical protein VHEMI03213 [[Torrubiella] hemipterigena]|uniref:Zn(2)-C6 fungal-type domain-containing protein n=1 Tax=[Torrubiella] hemipterigena TaxID=1531966 RepID=A0A0A1SS09_9HYPO|nr:hypothetical protein VHEMI03213 [[Torrubiella] hemipterigena]
MASIGKSQPLRSSCDWCRAQKLRCVPVPGTAPHAPCQRCHRAKPPRTCHFSARSRSGRTPKDGEAKLPPDYTRKLSMPDVAWTNMIPMPLSTLSSSGDSAPPSVVLPMDKDQDGPLSDDGTAASTVNQQDGAFNGLLGAESTESDVSEWYPALNRVSSVADKYGDTADREIAFSIAGVSAFEVDLDFDASLALLSEEPPCTVSLDLITQGSCGTVELSSLLADMARYETQMAMVSGGELE